MPDKKLSLSDDILAKAAAASATASAATIGGDPTEVLKNERATIEGNTKVQVAQLQVAKEAMEVLKGVFEVLKSRNQLQATITEWQGRITQAEIEVNKAEVNLQAARESNQMRAAELDITRDVLKAPLELFDHTMNEMKSLECSKEERAELRNTLLRISDQLVQLKK
jgi:hypothetical protein